MKKLKPLYFFYYAILICTVISSCIFIHTKVEPLAKEKLQESRTFVIKSSTKAHLFDGSVIVFPKGFKMRNNMLRGEGIKYDLFRQNQNAVSEVPLDSIASLEYYEKKWQPLPTLVSLPAVAATTSIIGVSIFGSCPTIYSFNGENYSLEAETFSYSIAKSFETDDLDRLDFGELIDGEYLLKVANEALETHYINQLSLLTVEHPTGYEAFPTDDNDIVLFGKESGLIEAKNKAGKDVISLISNRDGSWYQSDSLVIQELTQKVTQDWIDLKVKIPRNAKKMVVALQMRNTLLNTVLFYDVMLGSL